MKLSIEQLQQKLDVLSGYSPEVLAASSFAELKPLISGLIKGYSSMTKADVLKQIDEITRDLREQKRRNEDADRLEREAIAERLRIENEAAKVRLNPDFEPLTKDEEEVLPIENIPEENSIEELAWHYFNGLVEISRLDSKAKIYRRVNTLVSNLITKLRTGNVKDNADSTVSSASAAIRKPINLLIDNYDDKPTNASELKGTVKVAFNECLTDQSGAIQRTVSKDYKQRLNNLTGVRLDVDFSDYLRKSYEVLVNAEKSEKGEKGIKIRWEEVSTALALVTGRRQSEIHSTAKFEVIDEYILKFSGQLKDRQDEEENFDREFEIPTIVPAHLAVSGLQWLEKNNKRVSRDEFKCNRKIINKRYNSELSKWVKEKIIPSIDMDESILIEHFPKGFTYHTIRALYFIACLKNFRPKGCGERRYGGMILGHDYQRSDGSAKSYDKFELVDGAVTKM